MLYAVKSQVVIQEKGSWEWNSENGKKEVLSSVKAEKKEKPKAAKPAANSIYRRSQTKQNVAMNLLGSLKSLFIRRQTSFDKIYKSL